MNNIKYVYPLYERRGVDVNNVEQDLYGAIKTIPKAAAAGVGILSVWGYSKIKRMLAFRKAKNEIENYGDDFLEEIERWHSLNDKKLDTVCANAVLNYKRQIQSLEEQYKQIEQENANNPNFSGIPDRVKKQQVDKVLDVISKKLKHQVDEYYRGVNTWSTSLLKNYTDDIFATLIDEKMSKKINNSLRDSHRKNEGVSDVVGKFNFTKLSKKQVKKIEGLWLKKIMEVNSMAADMTNANVDTIKKKYFKQKGPLTSLAAIFELDVPKGFMTSETVDNIKSYIAELLGYLRYVDKDLMKNVDVDYNAPSEEPAQPTPTPTPSVAESASMVFLNRLNESKERIKNKKQHGSL